MNFGAFVQIAEGVDGLVHISEIVADRRINHPRDVLREGQRVQALVLAIDSEKRQIKLSMKQLIPDQHRRVHRRAQSRVTASPAASSSSLLPAQSSNSAKASARRAARQPRLALAGGRSASAVVGTLRTRRVRLGQARSLAALVDAEGPLERQRASALRRARAARRGPGPHLQNCEADADSKKIEVELA